jgi:hypothetical protein
MRTKLALAFLLLVLVALAGYLLLPGGVLHSAPPRPVPSAIATVAPVVLAWSGSATRQPAATFLRAGVQLSLDQVTFSGLNTTLSRVGFSFSLPKQGATPSWLNNRHFQLVAADGRVWLPVVSVRVGGATIYIGVHKAGLPTRALAGGSLRLVIRVPGDTPFSLSALPPAPPEGHAFAERKAPAPAKKHHKRKH